MSIDTRVLTGARWSSAVRCAAKAEHEALGSPRTDNPPPWLDSAFERGATVGEMWGLVQGKRLEAQGHEVSLEHEVAWGPAEWGWRGHVDVADVTDAICDEAYHSTALEFREEKALQVAGYTLGLRALDGREWRGVLTAVNLADADRSGGFAIRRIPVDVDGLREKVLEIQARVVTAAALGAYNPGDRVSDTPNHSECKACPFSAICHADYTPPAPEEVVGLEDSFQALRIATEDVSAAEAHVASAKRVRDGLRDAVREYVSVGVPVTSGSVTIRRTEVAGRVTVKLGDYQKAGYAIPAELEPFVNQGAASERWKVELA